MFAPLFRRLLFVEHPATDHMPVAGEANGFVLTGLVPRGVTPRRAARSLEQALTASDDRWGATHTTVLASRWWMRGMAAILLFTRRYRVATWFCKLRRQPGPPRYDEDWVTPFVAAVELRFDERPSDDAMALAMATLGAETKAVWVASDHQVVVYEAEPRPPKPAYISFLVHRPPSLTRESCQAFWQTTHAQLVLHNLDYLRLDEYRQVHTVALPPAGCDDRFDGIVWAQKHSVWALLAQLVQPNAFRFDNSLVVNETNFTYDTPALVLAPTHTWTR